MRLRVVVPGTYSNDVISAPGHVQKEINDLREKVNELLKQIDAQEEQDQKEKK